MSVFAVIKSLEPVVQVGDKVRLTAAGSFVAPGEPAITKIEIQPIAAGDFYDVTDSNSRNWYLDWIYSTDEDVTVTLRLTQDQEDPTEDIVTTVTNTLTVVDPDDDALFSTDKDLEAKDHDITRWVPDGYSSWNHIHRMAQVNILDWLDELRIYKEDGTRWVASEIVRKDQVRRLSLAMSLRMIYGSLSNQVGDVFDEKMKEWAKVEKECKNRNYILLDFGGDIGERAKDLRTFFMVKR